MELGELIGVVFIYMEKAFNTVDHDIWIDSGDGVHGEGHVFALYAVIVFLLLS